jgi:hypothetical protein
LRTLHSKQANIRQLLHGDFNEREENASSLLEQGNQHLPGQTTGKSNQLYLPDHTTTSKAKPIHSNYTARPRYTTLEANQHTHNKVANQAFGMSTLKNGKT